MIHKKKTIVLAITTAIASSITIFNSCVHAPYVLPQSQRTGDPNICFERDILPIFQSNCAKSGCHDSHGAGGYRLDNYQDIVRKGIVAGNPAASKIWASINYETGENLMPKGAGRLSDADQAMIREWIATGAIDSGACSTSNCDTNNYTYSGTIAPMVQLYCTGCHNSSSAPGGSLTDFASVYQAAVFGKLLGDINHLSGYNQMPLGGNQLSSCQLTQFQKWVAAGAPDN